MSGQAGACSHDRILWRFMSGSDAARCFTNVCSDTRNVKECNATGNKRQL